MPVYFLSSFPINKFSRCRALSPEVLRQREDGGVSPSPVFEKLSCIVFHKMKLILHQVRFDKLLPVLSDVKLENPEFKSQNLKNSEKNPEKSRKISEKILEKCKKFSEKSKKSRKYWKKSGKVQKTFQNPEDLATLVTSSSKIFRTQDFISYPPPSHAPSIWLLATPLIKPIFLQTSLKISSLTDTIISIGTRTRKSLYCPSSDQNSID